MMPMALVRGYVLGMRAVRRVASGDAGMVADAGIAIAGAGLTAVAAWGPAGLVGTAIDGPPWLLVLLPLLLGAPLLLRRRAPLLMWLAVWAGISLLDLVAGHLPQGLEFMFVLFVGGYSLGAYAGLRRAAIGLAVTAPVIVLTSRQGGLLAFPQHPGGASGAMVSFGFAEILAFWVAGVLVRARRQAAALAGRNAALQRQAERAAAAERARIARELHDIVAHHLSVMVL